jgi:hypothetical protein
MEDNLMLRIATFLAGIVLAAGAGLAQADLINVDFNESGTNLTYSGAAKIGSSGDIWNGAYLSSSNLALTNSAGSATGVTLSVSGSGLGAVWRGTGFNSTDYKNLMDDYITAASGTGTITLSGVSAGSYILYIYSACNHDRITYVTANSVGGTLTSLLATTTFTENNNYVKLSVVVDSSQTLTIKFYGDSSTTGEGDINGFQLQSLTVPEPATTILTVGGVLGLLAYAWRKRRKTV